MGRLHYKPDIPGGKASRRRSNTERASVLQGGDLSGRKVFCGNARKGGTPLKRHPPEQQVPDLSVLVQERYATLQSKNTEDELKRNTKFIQFREQIRDLRKQMGVATESADVNFEDEDEEIAVTQSIANFTCPITQMEMENPVKNKHCGHTYERDAIEKMIQNRQKKGKAARCPRIGCDHDGMQIADLIPDVALKRAIEVHKKKKSH